MHVVVISDTIQEFEGRRYYRCGRYFQRKGKRLHRAVWESMNGPVPGGFHVHHLDHDTANNQPNNLGLLRDAAHLSHHSSQPEARQRWQAVLKLAQAAAPAWHKSEDGREWHRGHGQTTWAELAPTAGTCQQCGEAFTVKVIQRRELRFCSNKCKSAARRSSGIDNENRTCERCGKVFAINKYQKNRYCSRQCVHPKLALARPGTGG